MSYRLAKVNKSMLYEIFMDHCSDLPCIPKRRECSFKKVYGYNAGWLLAGDYKMYFDVSAGHPYIRVTDSDPLPFENVNLYKEISMEYLIDHDYAVEIYGPEEAPAPALEPEEDELPFKETSSEGSLEPRVMCRLHFPTKKLTSSTEKDDFVICLDENQYLLLWLSLARHYDALYEDETEPCKKPEDLSYIIHILSLAFDHSYCWDPETHDRTEPGHE